MPEAPDRGSMISAKLAQIEASISDCDAESKRPLRAVLHRQAAQLLLGLRAAEARGRATEHLRAAWREDARDPDILCTLADCLEQTERRAELCDLYLEGLRRATDPAQQAEWLIRAVAELERDGGGGQRLDELRQALEGGAVGQWLARCRPSLARRLAEALLRLGARDVAAGLLELLASERLDDESYADSIRLAELYREQGQSQLAHDAYRRALSIRPAAREALDPVRRHLGAAKQFEQLAEFLAVSAAAAPSPNDRAKLWRELAQLAEFELRDPLRAAEACWRAWEIEGTEEDAAALRRLYAAADRWDRIVDVLRHIVLRTTDPDRKHATLRELAAVELERLNDPEAALASLALACQLDPMDLDSRELRLDLLQRTGAAESALRELRAYAQRCVDPERRDAVLQRQTALAVQGGQSFAALIAWVDQCEERGDRVSALAVLQRLAEVAPTHQIVQQKLASLRGETADARPVDVTAGEPASDAKVTVQQLVRRARACLARGDESAAAEARELLVHAASSCPGDSPELVLLAAALRDAGLLPQLAQLFEASLSSAGTIERKRELLWELAQLRQYELDQPREAAETLEQLSALGALGHDGYRRLELLYAQLKDLGRRARLLERWSTSARGDRRIRLLERLAQVYAEEVGSPDGESTCFQRILELTPDHEPALQHCRRREERLGNYHAVAKLLDRAAEACADPTRQEALYRDLAAVAVDELEDVQLAAATWRNISRLRPQDAAPRDRLRMQLRQASQWDELAVSLRVEVARTTESKRKVELYLELAEVCATRLEDQQTAILYLRQAQRLDPRGEAVLVRLEALYEQLGRWRELVSVLQHHAEEVEQLNERKVQLLHRVVGVLLTHLRRDEEALAVCRHARDLLPSDKTSTRLMGEVYTRRGQWQQLASLLRDRIANEQDEMERSRLHSELGVLLIDRLDDPTAGARQFERAMRCDPSAADVMAQLRRLYTALGRWDLLIQVLRDCSERSDQPPRERAAALCEVGRLYEEQLDDLESAREAYNAAAQQQPDFKPALDALRALAIAQGSWQEAVELTGRALKEVDDPTEKARLLVESAAMLRDHFDRPKVALEALERAIELDPDNVQAAQWLAGSYFAREDWARAGDLLQRVVDGSGDLQDLHEYYYRLAVACEHLDQAERAFAYYVKSFNREPMFLPTLDRLVDLCYERRQWQNATRIAEAIIGHYADQKSAAELADLHVRCGLCELHLAQRDVAVKRLRELMQRTGHGAFTSAEAVGEAADCWAATPLEPDLLGVVDLPPITRAIRQMERALQRVPEHPRALQVLVALTMSRGDWDRSLRYLERAAEAQRDDPAGQARLLLCAADIAAQKLLAVQRAREYCERATRCQPQSSSVRRRVARLLGPTSRAPADTTQATIDLSGAATQVVEMEERVHEREHARPARSRRSPRRK